MSERVPVRANWLHCLGSRVSSWPALLIFRGFANGIIRGHDFPGGLHPPFGDRVSKCLPPAGTAVESDSATLGANMDCAKGVYEG